MATKVKASGMEDALTAAIAALPPNCVPLSCAEIHQRRADWKARMAGIDAQLRQKLTELVALEAQRDGLLTDAGPTALKAQVAELVERRQEIADLEMIRSKMPARLAQLEKEYASAFAKAQAAALRDLRRVWDAICLQALEDPIPAWEDAYLAIAQIISGLAKRWCELAPPPGQDAVHRRVEGNAGDPALPAYASLPTGWADPVTVGLGELVHSIMANPAVQRRLRQNGHRRG